MLLKAEFGGDACNEVLPLDLGHQVPLLLAQRHLLLLLLLLLFIEHLERDDLVTPLLTLALDLSSQELESLLVGIKFDRRTTGRK